MPARRNGVTWGRLHRRPDTLVCYVVVQGKVGNRGTTRSPDNWLFRSAAHAACVPVKPTANRTTITATVAGALQAQSVVAKLSGDAGTELL